MPSIRASTRKRAGKARPTTRPVIYLASSIGTYRTERYDRMLTYAAGLFPGSDILPARGLFAGPADWLCRWPAVLAGLAGLVFFPDSDGCIGRGVWREIHGAQSQGLPIWLLDDDGTLTAFACVRLDRLGPLEDWRQYGRVCREGGPGDES